MAKKEWKKPKKGIYFRGDTRDKVKSFSSSNLYVDGTATRPEKCKTELAFANSMGGAVYGSAQYVGRDEYPSLPKDWGDQTPVFTVHVYGTKENVLPDYKPSYYGTREGYKHRYEVAWEDQPGDTDFEVMGEVRFCDREVPVEEFCSVDITKHDLAVMHTILNLKDSDKWEWFKEPISYAEIIANPSSAKERAMKPKKIPREDRMNPEEKGYDTDVVNLLIKDFEQRCKADLRKKGKGVQVSLLKFAKK